MPSYCQNDNCATVNYREYQGGKIRWRYGSEPWQEIIGADNYSSYSSYNLNANTQYRYVARGAIVQNGLFQGWGSEFRSTLVTFNGIQDWYVQFDKTLRVNGVTSYEQKIGFPPNDTFDYYYGNTFPSAGYRNISPTIWVLSQGSWRSFRLLSGVGIWITGIEPSNLNNATTQCQFKVFKKGVKVHSETRATCPQVEVIPCSLAAESKAIAVKKLADLERIEINNTGIPAECLNIYTTGNTAQYQAQICSASGCPPPQYEVVCCAQCDKCPENTCAVECGDHICCYEKDGISVKSIAKNDYCPS